MTTDAFDDHLQGINLKTAVQRINALERSLALTMLTVNNQHWLIRLHMDSHTHLQPDVYVAALEVLDGLMDTYGEKVANSSNPMVDSKEHFEEMGRRLRSLGID